MNISALAGGAQRHRGPIEPPRRIPDLILVPVVQPHGLLSTDQMAAQYAIRGDFELSSTILDDYAKFILASLFDLFKNFKLTNQRIVGVGVVQVHSYLAWPRACHAAPT